MNKLTLIYLASVLLAANCDALGGIEGLKERLRSRYGSAGQYGAASATSSASGAGGAARAEATASAGYASRAQAAASAGYSPVVAQHQPAPVVHRPAVQPPQYVQVQPAYDQYASAAAASTANVVQAAAPVRPAINLNRFRHQNPSAHYVRPASAAAASSASVVRAPEPVAPVRPAVNLNRFKHNNHALHSPRFAGAAAGLGAASASAATENLAESLSESNDESYAHNPEANVHSAASGTYVNDGKGLETSSYKRSTENVENHEDGRADDNHYYNAQSYGKAEDENEHEAFNSNDEDVYHTPQVYRSKKSNVNYVKDLNKARRESGSGVLAKDKHSSAYNKNSKRFIENVDQQHRKEGEGIFENTSDVTSQNLDDEDEELYDSDGLGTFQGHGAQASGPARAVGGAAASSAVSGGPYGSSVATSAAVSAANGRHH